MDFEIDKAVAVLLRLLKNHNWCSRYAPQLAKLYVSLAAMVAHNRELAKAVELRSDRP